MNAKRLNSYFREAVEHRRIHRCGGMPFEHGKFLTTAARERPAKNILEIGTAIGYSTTCFALGRDTIFIDTIDMYADHSEIAQHYWKKFGVLNQITFHCGDAHDLVPALDTTYDIIFFDGYAPLPNLVGDFSRLLGPTGLLISSNLELPSEVITTPEYLNRLDNNGLTTSRFGDIAFSSHSLSSLDQTIQIWESL